MKEIILGLKEELKNVKSKQDLEVVIAKIHEKKLKEDYFKKEILNAKANIDIQLLADLIVEVDIPGVGKKTAYNIAEYFKNASTLAHLIEKDIKEVQSALTFVNGISDKLSKTISDHLMNMLVLMKIHTLASESYNQKIYNIVTKELTTDEILNFISKKPKVTQGIKGLNIVVNLYDEEAKERVEDFILRNGGVIQKIVMNSTNYLIIDKNEIEENEASIEYAKALAFNHIDIMDEEELISRAKSKIVYNI